MLYCNGSNLEALTARVDGQGRGRVAGKESRAFFLCFAETSSDQNQQHLGNCKRFTLFHIDSQHRFQKPASRKLRLLRILNWYLLS